MEKFKILELAVIFGNQQVFQGFKLIKNTVKHFLKLSLLLEGSLVLIFYQQIFNLTFELGCTELLMAFVQVFFVASCTEKGLVSARRMQANQACNEVRVNDASIHYLIKYLINTNQHIYFKLSYIFPILSF